MNPDDPERRIAELERQLAEQTRATGPKRTGITAEQVHTVAFTEASRSQGAYDRDEVDAFLVRVEETLRNPTGGGVTPADLRAVEFSEPPVGRFGYNEGEVDLFLDRVRGELTRRESGQDSSDPVRYVLYPYGGWDPQTPVRAIDVGKDALRVFDLKTNELLGSFSVAEVTAKPAQHGGGPVLIVDGPGLDPMPIGPHPMPGVWRKRPKSKKPAYLAVEDDWLALVDHFGMASDLADEYEPQNLFQHIGRFFEEQGAYAKQTWRTPLVFGLLVGVPGAIYGSPIAILIGVIALLLAALAWRFKWEI